MPLVQEPLFELRWGHQSFFRDKWDAMDRALAYVVDEYPEFRKDRVGLARIEAQRAFALAAQGERARGLVPDRGLPPGQLARAPHTAWRPWSHSVSPPTG